MEKIRILLKQIDDAIVQERSEPKDVRAFTGGELKAIASELNDSLQKCDEPATKEEKQQYKERKKQIKQLKAHADKLIEYEEKLNILGNRNSYSKTDHDATFMRMKEDAMNNGQTKPGYNLQIGTENQFILDYGLFQTPGDPLTMIPFFNSFLGRYSRLPSVGVADSGYGSEENYRFMDEAGIEAFVKYNWFHREQRMHYKPIHSVHSHYIIMQRETTIYVRWDNGWNASVQSKQRQKAGMSPKASVTQLSAVKDAPLEEAASRQRETG